MRETDHLQPSRSAAGPQTGRPLTRGRPFTPGNTVGKRGRPKGIKATVLRKIGQSGERAINALFAIATNPTNSVRQQMEAWALLLDRGFGRPAQTTTLEGGDPMRPLIIDRLVFGGRYKSEVDAEDASFKKLYGGPASALAPFTVPAEIPPHAEDADAGATMPQDAQLARGAPVPVSEAVASLAQPWQPVEDEPVKPTSALGALIDWLV